METETQKLLNTIEEGNINHLQTLFKKDTTLEQFLTFNYQNHDGKYHYDEEILKDAQALLGKSTSNLNLLQIAIFLGDEEIALEILKYVAEMAHELGSKKILMEFMGKMWGESNTSLHLASFHGMSELVKLLLICGANIRKVNDRKYKAVDCADDDQTRHLFLQKESAESLKPSTLESQVSSLKLGSKRKMRVSFEFRTVLFDLFREGNLDEIIRMLDKRTTDLHLPNEMLITPLHIVASTGNCTLIEFIKQYQHRNKFTFEVDPIDTQGWTPLHFAASEDKTDAVKLLLSLGADPNAVNYDGESVSQVTDSKVIIALLQ